MATATKKEPKKESPKLERLKGITKSPNQLQFGDVTGKKNPRGGVDLMVVERVSPSYYVRGSSVQGQRKTERGFEMVTEQIANTSPVKVLTGATAKTTLKEWNQHRRKNFQRDGVRSCFQFAGAAVGSDPEVFVVGGDGRVMPAYEFLRRKEEASTQNIDGGNNRSFYGYASIHPVKSAFWDGVQAEFVTKPYGCLAFHVDSIFMGLRDVLMEARKKDPKATLSTANVCELGLESLATLPQEYVALGCMPSQNAYGEEPLKVEDPRLLPWRFAGGHQHYAISHHDYQDRFPEIVKMLDVGIGVLSVAATGEIENPIRRRFYGRAGEYRTPKHGLEYRVLSATTMLAHPAICHLFFDLGRIMVGVGVQKYRDLWEGSEDRVRKIINNLDVQAARKFVQVNEELYRGLLEAKWFNGTPAVKWAMELFQKGIGAVVKNPTDIVGNWFLEQEPIPSGSVRDLYLQRPEQWVSHSEGKNCCWGSAASELEKGNMI